MLDFIFKNAVKLGISMGLIIESKTEVAFCHPTELINITWPVKRVDILNLLLD